MKKEENWNGFHTTLSLQLRMTAMAQGVCPVMIKLNDFSK